MTNKKICEVCNKKITGAGYVKMGEGKGITMCNTCSVLIKRYTYLLSELKGGYSDSENGYME